MPPRRRRLKVVDTRSDSDDDRTEKDGGETETEYEAEEEEEEEEEGEEQDDDSDEGASGEDEDEDEGDEKWYDEHDAAETGGGGGGGGGAVMQRRSQGAVALGGKSRDDLEAEADAVSAVPVAFARSLGVTISTRQMQRFLEGQNSPLLSLLCAHRGMLASFGANEDPGLCNEWMAVRCWASVRADGLTTRRKCVLCNSVKPCRYEVCRDDDGGERIGYAGTKCAARFRALSLMLRLRDNACMVRMERLPVYDVEPWMQRLADFDAALQRLDYIDKFSKIETDRVWNTVVRNGPDATHKRGRFT